MLEDEIRVRIETDDVTAEQVQPAGAGDGGDARRQAVDVRALGRLPLQAEHQCPVAAVAAAGRRQRQRAVEMDADRADAFEVAGRLQGQHELPRRPHRTDRMGARRADADGEEIRRR